MRFAVKPILMSVALAAAALLLPNAALAADGGVCPRPDPGSEVLPPPDVYGSGGALNVALDYQTAIDFAGRTLFCYTTADGQESPTLHVNPGDTVTISLTNKLPASTNGPSEITSSGANQCGDRKMTMTSANMHFHGLNVSPKCHGDETIHTLINSGETFSYKLKIPADEPPGLYWYHPHVHGVASPNVQGGGTGAIVVEGIENIQPAVAGLPQRILVLRDQPLLNAGPGKNGPAPFWDVSVNYVAVPYPQYPPAIIKMQRGTQEFWRVANAAANTIMDIEVDYDGKAQLQVVGLDGVPTGSQDGTQQGKIITERHILLSPAGRAEFIVAAPTQSTTKAALITRAIDGGPDSDSNPRRRMAEIVTTASPVKLPRVPERSRPPHRQRFEDAAKVTPTATRTLYFWEVPFAPRKPKTKPGESTLFFIVVKGQEAVAYDPRNPPAIVTNQGAVEDWTIQNQTGELHEFHIHQIHFLVLEVNGKPVPKKEQQWHDTYQVPYWTRKGPYPSIKVRMDFRGAVVGDFVYHCHILDHEDAGMMAIIRVNPKKG